MAGKHTPGPWRARLNNFMRWEIMYASGQLANIATPDDPASPPKRYAECKANAHLIAAAPDLLQIAHDIRSLLTQSETNSER